MLLKDSPARPTGRRFSLADQARAWSVILGDEFGVPFVFYEAAADGTPSAVWGEEAGLSGPLSASALGWLVADGRPRVEPSFLPGVVDRMVAVPDAASIAAARHVSAVLGRQVGPSTGTNLWGAFRLVAEMLAAGRSGSVVTLLCDGGERYAHTYYSDEWLAAEALDLAPYAATLQEFAATGRWSEPA